MAEVRCWAVASQKGGVGKTTVIMNLADGLHRAGYRVLVVDMDPQGSATKWERKRVEDYESFPTKVEPLWDVNESDVKRWLLKRVEDYDFFLFDTPPKLRAPELRAALMVADTVIVPFYPHASTIDALEELRPLLEQIQEERVSPFQMHLVVNRFNTRREGEKQIVKIAGQLFHDANVLDTQLKDLSAFAEAYNFRTSLFALPSSRDAKKAITLLTQELLNYGNH